MNKTEFLQISSLEKVFMEKRPECSEIAKLSALKNERVSYQIAYFKKNAEKKHLKITIDSPLEKYITVRRVLNVPVQMPLKADNCDDDYLMTAPGLAPDALIPIDIADTDIIGARWESFWITVDLDGEVNAGKYDIKIAFTFEEDEEVTYSKTMALDIINAELPAQSLVFTQWFHCDCIASYFNVPMFSEEHWGYIERFVKCAAKNGINMILTPVFTPPLDTAIGAERPTAQLVAVRKTGESYSFDFSALNRWIDMCRKNGIEYFEISHLFTQWGAKCTPKIMAEVDGEEKRIFGWDVSSTSEEYKAFLQAFLPSMDAYLKEKGIADKTYFHISDEPHGDEAKANYLAAKAIVKKYLSGYKIMDALSDVAFYKEGVVELPVPANDQIESFLRADIKERWTYYCTCQANKVSNRFIAMPSYRNRVIADQMFKYNISGFLHWGYNFYYTQRSEGQLNPYVITDADGAFQSGDAFSVYPYKDGVAESLRIIVFADGISDMRAMELLASKIGREAVVQLIEKEAGMNIEFGAYPKCAEYILRRREVINQRISELF
ncbi:MAG: DUF4091 domain-containing protein [Oscillospiraceae bacterium]|nr:DUF4091 domain-containing protein [Oscillospiraceae bacterium]